MKEVNSRILGAVRLSGSESDPEFQTGRADNISMAASAAKRTKKAKAVTYCSWEYSLEHGHCAMKNEMDSPIPIKGSPVEIHAPKERTMQMPSVSSQRLPSPTGADSRLEHKRKREKK